MMTVTGLNETLQRLSEIEGEDNNGKTEEALRRVAEIGVEVAQRLYSHSTSHPPDVTYSFINENTVCVRAESENVLFLEFGTGITYMREYPPDGGFNPTYMVGDWSDNEALGGKGLWRSPYGWWFTNDAGNSQHTMGNPPVMAMYYAKKEMEQRLDETVREVFGND